MRICRNPTSSGKSRNCERESIGRMRLYVPFCDFFPWQLPTASQPYYSRTMREQDRSRICTSSSSDGNCYRIEGLNGVGNGANRQHVNPMTTALLSRYFLPQMPTCRQFPYIFFSTPVTQTKIIFSENSHDDVDLYSFLCRKKKTWDIE